MSKEVTVRSVGAIDFAKGLSQEQVQLLKDTVCKEATDDELKLFLYQCEQRKLDPFAKQIHAVKRWDSNLERYVMAYQTGIDAYRLIAQRTGFYQGQVSPMWCGKDGIWKDVWLEETPPAAARVGVLRKGNPDPIWGVALWREYVQKTRQGQPVKMWMTMPAGQLAKCAEALALRKAFPEDLAGLHTEEEMNQADNPPALTKAEDITAAMEQSKVEDPAIEVASRPVEPPPAQPCAPFGDELMDYIVPSIVKKLANKRLGEIPTADLEATLVVINQHFEKERRPPAGRWLEFITKAKEIIERRKPDWELETPTGTIGTPEEPGSDG